MLESCDVFDIVFVCTGNRARSPLAAVLFRRYSEGVDVCVRSVGTLELGLLPALPQAVEAGRDLLVDLSGHLTRSVRDVDLSSTDVVLGFESFHVSAAIDQGRARPERTFMLRELVALLETDDSDGDPTSRARALVARADSRRVRADWTSAGASIADPMGKPAEFMRATAAEIDRLVRQLVQRLFGIEA